MLRPADAYSQQTLLAHCSGPVPRNGVGAGDAEFARVCRCFCTASLWPKPEAEPFTVVGGGRRPYFVCKAKKQAFPCQGWDVCLVLRYRSISVADRTNTPIKHIDKFEFNSA